jgi:hypothetical protein
MSAWEWVPIDAELLTRKLEPLAAMAQRQIEPPHGGVVMRSPPR